jgi:hypothetical protein
MCWKLNTALHANANCNYRHQYGSNYGQGPQDKEESWDRWLLLDVSQVYNVDWPAADNVSLTVLGLNNAGPLKTDFWSARGPSLHDQHTQSCQQRCTTGVCITVGKQRVLWDTTEPWPRVYLNQTRMGQICVSVYFRSIAANALEYSRGSSHTYILEL